MSSQLNGPSYFQYSLIITDGGACLYTVYSFTGYNNYVAAPYSEIFTILLNLP